MNIKKIKTKLTTESEGKIKGYASVFGGIDCYNDTIEKNAYDNVIKEGILPKMFFNHDELSLPIGKWESMSVDDKGFLLEGSLNLELEKAKELYSAIKFGSVDGLSIGFGMNDGDFEYDKDDVRHINNISQLYEVSIVTFPADGNARISDIKSLDDLDSLSEIEHYLRDAGSFSRKDATSIVSRIKRVLSHQSDSEKEQDFTSVVEKLRKLNQKLKGE